MKKLLLTLFALTGSGCLLTFAQSESMNPFAKFNYDANIAVFGAGVNSDSDPHVEQAKIIEIGSVLFDTELRQVVGFADEKDNPIVLDAETTSTSIDPHCEKYYWISPYAYCFNNPVRFIDPDGRDVWEINRDGHVVWKEESDNHVLYALDKEGSRTGESITVKDRDILDQLTQNKDDYTGNYAASSSSEIAGVFLFAANNTDVEWGLAGFNSGDLVLTTSHLKDKVYQVTTISGYNEGDMNFKVHSHPGNDAPRGASVSSVQKDDMDNIRDMAHRFNNAGNYTHSKFPKHFVYHPETKNLYQYTPYTKSINLGNVNGKTLLNKIRNSKSTVYPH